MKGLKNTDKFLGELCAKIDQGYQRKNNVIKSLLEQLEEKNACIQVKIQYNFQTLLPPLAP